MISSADIKALREKTGVGMMDCKKEKAVLSQTAAGSGRLVWKKP